MPSVPRSTPDYTMASEEDSESMGQVLGRLAVLAEQGFTNRIAGPEEEVLAPEGLVGEEGLADAMPIEEGTPQEMRLNAARSAVKRFQTA